MANPLVANNPASIWKLAKKRAEAFGQRDYEMLVSKPIGVDIYSASEFIQRVVGGQYTLQLRPGINAEEYVFEIQLFMRTEQFTALNPLGQQTLMKTLKIADTIAQAEQLAKMHAQALLNKRRAGGEGKDDQEVPNGQTQPTA